MSTVVRFYEYGSPEVFKVEEEQVGQPGLGQVRLRHEAIGVNYIDTAFRQGSFPMRLPGVTGVEGAGIVEAIGPDVRGIQAGDRMAYFLAPGAYAAVRMIDAEHLLRMPDDLTSAQVATILTKGLTAWAGLNGFYKLQAGETVLVQGASSNVGQLLARWAKARGATVIGTAGSESKRESLARSIDLALLSGSDDVLERILEVAPEGVDVVYEFVGKATFAASVASVRRGGAIVNIGAGSGSPSIDKEALARRRIRVTGGPMAEHLHGVVGEAATAVFEAFRKGVFGEIEATVYPLKNAAKAHEDIAARRKTGPMILVP